MEWGDLEMSGDTFDDHNLGGFLLHVWVETRDSAKHPTICKIVSCNQNYLEKDVLSAKFERLFSRGLDYIKISERPIHYLSFSKIVYQWNTHCCSTCSSFRFTTWWFHNTLWEGMKLWSEFRRWRFLWILLRPYWTFNGIYRRLSRLPNLRILSLWKISLCTKSIISNFHDLYFLKMKSRNLCLKFSLKQGIIKSTLTEGRSWKGLHINQ